MLFLQQFFDMGGIVQARVQVEHEFRNDAELFAHHVTEFATEGLVVLVEEGHDGLLLVGREDAYVDLGDRKVGAHADFAYRDEGAVEGGHPLGPDDLREVLLDLPCDFELSGAGRLFH